MAPWRAIRVVALCWRPSARSRSRRVTPSAPHSHALGLWAPGAADTCPAALHDSYSVVGPDGKLYPTWHPPRVIDPATGELCSFGHEHGRNPAGSDLSSTGSPTAGRPGARRRGGHPVRARERGAGRLRGRPTPALPTRHEDHVGHKIEWENDVELERASGGGRSQIGVTCDFLTKSTRARTPPTPLATTSTSCSTRCAATTAPACLRRSSSASGCRTSSSAPATSPRSSRAGTSHPTPPAAAFASSPTAPASRTTSWSRAGSSPSSRGACTRTGSRRTTCARPAASELAYFDPHFAVFNPSRYGYDGGSIGRVIDVCWETEPGGEPPRGGACGDATARARSSPAPLRLRRVALQRRPPRGLLQPDRRSPTRAAPGAGGPIRYGGNALHGALPGRRLPARRARSTTRAADARVPGVRRRSALRRPRRPRAELGAAHGTRRRFLIPL